MKVTWACRCRLFQIIWSTTEAIGTGAGTIEKKYVLQVRQQLNLHNAHPNTDTCKSKTSKSRDQDRLMQHMSCREATQVAIALYTVWLTPPRSVGLTAATRNSIIDRPINPMIFVWLNRFRSCSSPLSHRRREASAFTVSRKWLCSMTDDHVADDGDSEHIINRFEKS